MFFLSGRRFLRAKAGAKREPVKPAPAAKAALDLLAVLLFSCGRLVVLYIEVGIEDSLPLVRRQRSSWALIDLAWLLLFRIVDQASLKVASHVGVLRGDVVVSLGPWKDRTVQSCEGAEQLLYGLPVALANGPRRNASTLI